MSFPSITFITTQSVNTTTIVCFVEKTQQSFTIHAPTTHSNIDSIQQRLLQFERCGFQAQKDEALWMPSKNEKPSYLFVGIQNIDDPNALRYSCGTALKHAKTTTTLTFDLRLTTLAHLQAFCEGAFLASYCFDRYRTQKFLHTTLSQIEILDSAPPPSYEQTIDNARILAQSVTSTKTLINTPAADLGAKEFTKECERRIENLPIDIQVWKKKELQKDYFPGILAVGKGSARPPRLIKLSYTPPTSLTHIAFVGKGIVFDSGGLSLKPSNFMMGMKYDMTGAATVLNAICAIAELGMPIRVTSWLCLAENMPSGTALRPGDILTMKNGKTVEVTNTDAEGRLVLADGLCAAEEEHPDILVDVATLTGAAGIALGSGYGAVMGTDPHLTEIFLEASKKSGEPFWHMPLPEDLKELLSSDMADLQNASLQKSEGGMLVAGLFLQEFVTTSRWLHLDIAGCAKPLTHTRGFNSPGAPGVAVRTLIKLAEELCAQ